MPIYPVLPAAVEKTNNSAHKKGRSRGLSSSTFRQTLAIPNRYFPQASRNGT
jgi:hypothetical protein